MSTEFDDALQSAIAGLPKERLPQRDLWTGVEMALLNRSRRRVPWLALAASVLVCVIAAGAWFRSHRAAHSATSHVNYVEQLAVQHRNTIRALQAAYRNTPALTTNWNEQLNGMERAADSVRKALRDDPDNIALLKMLNDVYQQEVDLLRRVHEPLPNDQII
jgi:hypothetical protein